MEKRIPLKVTQVVLYCDECDGGQMKNSGVMLTTHPPWYPHQCDKCDYIQKYRKSYPYIDYEEDDNG
jgi:hypothetical protein